MTGDRIKFWSQTNKQIINNNYLNTLVARRSTKALCNMIRSIKQGTFKVKLNETDIKFLRDHVGKETAKQMLRSSTDGSDTVKLKEDKVSKQMSRNFQAVINKYPLFKAWPQVLKQVLMVR